MSQPFGWLAFVLALFLGSGFAWSVRTADAGPREERAEPGPSGTVALEAKPVTFATEIEPIRPLPPSVALDERKVALGEMLFNDPRLSGDDSVACVSCHDLTKDGTDQRARSVGIGGAEGARNAPTVFNSGFNFAQLWDGRAATLEDQIDEMVESPKELSSSWPEILAKLRRDPKYAASFQPIYGNDITRDNVKDAIATFERSLITPNARFDRFLRGESDALTDEEEAGYELFESLGCIACHQGMNIGGNMFERMGLFGRQSAVRGDLPQTDYGRFNVTGRERDRYVFKVPSLRNVAVTAPYFHDGSAKTLDAAVIVMVNSQLGRMLSVQERKRLVAFLKTLTGEYRERPL